MTASLAPLPVIECPCCGEPVCPWCGEDVDELGDGRCECCGEGIDDACGVLARWLDS